MSHLCFLKLLYTCPVQRQVGLHARLSHAPRLFQSCNNLLDCLRLCQLAALWDVKLHFEIGISSQFFAHSCRVFDCSALREDVSSVGHGVDLGNWDYLCAILGCFYVLCIDIQHLRHLSDTRTKYRRAVRIRHSSCSLKIPPWSNLRLHILPLCF